VSCDSAETRVARRVTSVPVTARTTVARSRKDHVAIEYRTRYGDVRPPARTVHSDSTQSDTVGTSEHIPVSSTAGRPGRYVLWLQGPLYDGVSAIRGHTSPVMTRPHLGFPPSGRPPDCNPHGVIAGSSGNHARSSGNTHSCHTCRSRSSLTRIVCAGTSTEVRVMLCLLGAATHFGLRRCSGDPLWRGTCRGRSRTCPSPCRP
jgi:hypothetical protein